MHTTGVICDDAIVSRVSCRAPLVASRCRAGHTRFGRYPSTPTSTPGTPPPPPPFGILLNLRHPPKTMLHLDLFGFRKCHPKIPVRFEPYGFLKVPTCATSRDPMWSSSRRVSDALEVEAGLGSVLGPAGCWGGLVSCRVDADAVLWGSAAGWDCPGWADPWVDARRSRGRRVTVTGQPGRASVRARGGGVRLPVARRPG